MLKCVYSELLFPRAHILECADIAASSAARVVAFLILSVVVSAQTPDRTLPLLIHADQVRQLKPEQATLGYPVRVRGVVTNDVPAPDFFVQDSSAGVYVEGARNSSFAHKFGDLIEVEG